MPNRVEGVRPNVPRVDELDGLTVAELEDIRDTLDRMPTRVQDGPNITDLADRVDARLLALGAYDD